MKLVGRLPLCSKSSAAALFYEGKLAKPKGQPVKSQAQGSSYIGPETVNIRTWILKSSGPMSILYSDTKSVPEFSNISWC